MRLLLVIIGTIAFNTSLRTLYIQPLCVVIFCDIEFKGSFLRATSQ